MSDTKTYERNIYCLEGNWNKNPRSNQSVKPMLELLRTFANIKYVYYKCDTKEEFYKRLQQFTKGTYKTMLFYIWRFMVNLIALK